MKLRQGFVSNSSSSSFIILEKRIPPCKTCGREYPSVIEKTIEKNDSGYGNTELIARGSDEVIAKLKSWLKEGIYDKEEEKNIKGIINRIMEMSGEKAEGVAILEIDYNDEDLMELLHQENIEILRERG